MDHEVVVTVLQDIEMRKFELEGCCQGGKWLAQLREQPQQPQYMPWTGHDGPLLIPYFLQLLLL